MTENVEVPTHLAFADETQFNVRRYRGIAMISLQIGFAKTAIQELRKLLDSSDLVEFKWVNLRGARERFDALKMVDFAIAKCLENLIRIDVLSWDTHDTRHNVYKRDDLVNLGLMYYQLSRNVFRKRWPDNSKWKIQPDQNSAIDWETLKETLQASQKLAMQLGPLPDGIDRITIDFDLLSIFPCDSKQEPLVQLADLFVGMAVYSRQNYQIYEQWEQDVYGQLSFPHEFEDTVKLSNADYERCLVLQKFDKLCKARKMGVSLRNRSGLWTPRPNNPINFWWYEPQHPDETAPVRAPVAED
ncbi:MAG: DUF3800 domain-containing protein [Anaerolineae bacterium]|nr:DUF3800 domain-containing protein [Anaerolineae bacterium]